MEEYENYSNVGVNFNQVMMKTFFWMFMGLLSTGLIAFITYNSTAFVEIAMAWPIIAILELVVVIVFRLTLKRAPAMLVAGLFFIYSILNGFTFSMIFAAYDLGTIAYAFFGTSALFGGLALVGYITKRDISNIGTILFVGLIVGIVLSLINLFIGSEPLSILIDWLVIAIFCGYTIYDMNRLKMLSASGEYPSEKIEIYFALELYLDFINLFIRLLKIIGRARD